MERNLKGINRLVVKIGTSSLTYENAKLNLGRIDQLARCLTDLVNQGKEVLLVTSGAVGVGMGKMNISEKPESVPEKQALASIGQASLMKIYQRLFSSYNQNISQVLLTKGIMKKENLRENASNTLNKLLEWNVIPIINENDTVATDEIVYGDNDRLSAYVTTLVDADLLVLLSDIDGLYTDNPSINKEAQLISEVSLIDESVKNYSNGNGSKFGTGGMRTKIQAAEICAEKNIPCVIANAQKPNVILDIINNKKVGTLFLNQNK
jgi:glutamate 5-kinase